MNFSRRLDLQIAALVRVRSVTRPRSARAIIFPQPTVNGGLKDAFQVKMAAARAECCCAQGIINRDPNRLAVVGCLVDGGGPTIG